MSEQDSKQDSKLTFVDDIHLREDDETKYTPSIEGSFQRGPCNLQDWIGQGEYAPDSGRYHVFINYGCGWCHQVMIAIQLKGLGDVISISHIGPKRLGERGTPSYGGYALASDPTGNGFKHAGDVYNSNRDYGVNQLTIPILFDKKTKKVVSNDPAHIILMINCIFEAGDSKAIDLYPPQRRIAIEAWNDIIFPGINDGVYRLWFPRTQEAYDDAYAILRQALHTVDEKLQQSRFLCGDEISLADVRAFPHLFRFDVIYHQLMLREPRGPMLNTYPGIMRWLQEMFEDPRVNVTCDLVFATTFYMGGSSPGRLTNEEVETRYVENRYDWMPTLEQVYEKREREAAFN